MFFRHGAAHKIGLSQRIPRKVLENLHHLFLIHDNAIGIFQNRFEIRRIVHDPLGMVLVLNILRNEIHRSRAIQRDAGDQIFEAVRLQIFHEFFHAALFKLEHGVGIARGNQLIRFGNVVTYFVEVDIDPVILLDILQRILHIGKRGEREKVHFQHAHRFHFFHIELRNDIVAVPRKRHVIRKHFTADHHARGVFGSVLRRTLQFQPHIDHAVQIFVVFVHFDEFRVPLRFLIGEFLFEILPILRGKIGILQFLLYPRYFQPEQFFDRGLSVHQFRHFIRFGIRNPHHAPYVLDYGAGSQRTERNDLRHVRWLIFLPHVFDRFVATFRAEVHVEIGHGYTIGV